MLQTNPRDWLVMPGYKYDEHNQCFCVTTEPAASHTSLQEESHHSKLSLSSLQAPLPLTKGKLYTAQAGKQHQIVPKDSIMRNLRVN